MLFNAANGTFHVGLHFVIVCYHQLEHDIVFGAIFFDLFRLELYSTVYAQVTNISASKGDELL